MNDLKKRIENDFHYHKPDDDAVRALGEIRTACRDLANLIANVVPAGREQSNAISRLEEVMMHANAGIARKFPVEKP